VEASDEDSKEEYEEKFSEADASGSNNNEAIHMWEVRVV
jgi:hypothetical protein